MIDTHENINLSIYKHVMPMIWQKTTIASPLTTVSLNFTNAVKLTKIINL